jgi:hypothetical protein
MAAKKTKPKIRKRGVGRRIEVREKDGSLRFDVLRMSGHDLYAVLSAVRGPDANSNSRLLSVKSEITERIRGIVFVDSCPGSYNESVLGEYGLRIFKIAYEQLAEMNTPGVSHYMNHLLLAVRATRKHPVWGNHAEKIIGMLGFWA